ncbi:membrane protein, partial [Bacillus thuringiensis]|nr:membrane protein [Bacillus thuringiensis]
ILSLKNKTARDFFEGKSTVLIKDGKILEDNLKKEKYTSDELLELLRGKSAFSVAEVEFAVLEPSGELNVLLKKDSQPLTAKDIGLKVPNEKEP